VIRKAKDESAKGKTGSKIYIADLGAQHVRESYLIIELDRFFLAMLSSI